MSRNGLLMTGCLWSFALFLPAAHPGGQRVEHLRELDVTVIRLEEMMSRVVREEIQQVNRKSSAEWRMISTKEQWERYRIEKLARLRESLGLPSPNQGPPPFHVTGNLSGDGYSIENLVFESRPGIWVTANLYIPHPVRASMPGILICHSHHNPKTQGELQDMGMTWARWGCLTLVMDQPGHGERRDHPFHSQSDYPEDFRLGRQDYYFRYDLGIQLHLVGESLIGWMVWDLMRGLDLLLTRDGIDREKLILLGAVAGGGDPAAVTAALDERITGAVPLNFGGPQGYHPYPLPEDAEESFNYAGSGSWESTRNLRLSCRDGFLPWVIVGGIAPRRLVYAHEFSWDRERDPVWKRLLGLYENLYEVPDRLDYSHGYGVVRKRPPEASHCNNIGPVQRERIHPAFRRWFGIEGSREKEYSQRREPEELLCMTERWRRKLKPLKMYEKAAERARFLRHEVESDLAKRTASMRLRQLREQWKTLLGPIEPVGERTVLNERRSVEGEIEISRVLLKEASGSKRTEVLIPLVILQSIGATVPRSAVVCVSQAGKSRFLRECAEEIALLLEEGLCVCLVDVRGTGETSTGGGRGRTSQDTDISSSILMLGKTLVGERLRDLRAVLQFLRNRPEIDERSLLIWGDALQEANPASRNLRMPRGLDSQPLGPEPLGGLLALLTGLFEPDLRSIYIRGGLVGFETALTGPFCYLPHDAVIPGVISTGDLPLLARALGAQKVRLEGLVDALNCRIPEERLVELYPRMDVIQTADPRERVAWMLQSLR